MTSFDPICASSLDTNVCPMFWEGKMILIQIPKGITFLRPFKINLLHYRWAYPIFCFSEFVLQQPSDICVHNLVKTVQKKSLP